MSQNPEQGNIPQTGQPQAAPQPQHQQDQTESPQRQYQPGYQQKQYSRKQYYGKKNYRGNYGQRRSYNDYQGDKNHARIVVSRKVYHKLIQFVLQYHGTLKGMSQITSDLLDKAIDEAIADKENRKRYADEMHLHSEI